MATGESTLHVIRDAKVDSADVIDVVLVPGVGTSPPEEWSFVDEKWLGTLPVGGADLRILGFNYNATAADGKTTWESVLLIGYELLRCLVDTRPAESEDAAWPSTRPIVLVCHSLGGLIVKQALCVANKQFPRYGRIINAVVGVVLLSTPHRYENRSTAATRLRDISDSTAGRQLKLSIGTNEHESAFLTDLADRFEGIRLRTPTLSVYEMRETKISSTPLRTKYILLVDRHACSTHAPLEQVIGLNLNHHDTCFFTRSLAQEGLAEFNAFIRHVLRGAVELVAARLDDQEYQYATTSAYSPTMSEMPIKIEDLDLNEHPSNLATEYPSNKTAIGTSNSGFEFVYPSTPEPERRRAVRLPCFLLTTHSVNEDFCGREDVLQRLADELLPSENVVTASGTALRQFALCGFGGIGKTEIAREFCHRHRESFDAIFWVVADEVAKLDQHYQQISLALGLEDATDCKSQVVSREIVKGWLSSPQKQLGPSEELAEPGATRSEANWLLIFDNADDPLILADYWPQGSGSILITSRDPLTKSMFTSRSAGIDLGPLSHDDSLLLFNHLTSAFTSNEDDTALQISDALGGVPLAISQMAGIIRRQDLTLAEFLELYKDHEEHSNLFDSRVDTNLVPYRYSLSTVWAFEKLKPQARHLLEIVSFLDPDVISEELLIEAATQALPENMTFKKSSFIEARADLIQSSLVQRDKQKQQLSVHRIVQGVIFANMDESKRQEIFSQVVRVLWASWPSAMPKPSKEPELPKPKSSGNRLHVGRWPTCAAIYPHVLRMHALFSAIPDLTDAARLHFAKLLTEAAWYQKERGRTRDFDGFFKSARSICESSTHPDRDSLLADIHFCLGSVSMDASDWAESRFHKEQSLRLVRGICDALGVADERLYLALAEMGISRTQDKRYEEAEADFAEALRMRKALGNYIPRSGEANMSWGLMAQGKLDQCDELLTSSLEAREAALGKNDRESVRTGLILYALGNLRALQGRLDESFTFHERTLQHMYATVGERDFYTAAVLHKVAEHYVRMQRYDEAITTLNKALDIWLVDESSRKNEIARTTFFKGKVFEAMGKTQKSTIAIRVAARLRKEITGEERDVKRLTIQAFDEIVAFWAR